MRELFEISKSALFASNRAIQTTGHNIANANTPGFSRQRVNTSPVDYLKNGRSIGLGLKIDQVERLRSEIIDRQLREKESSLGGFNEQARIFQQMEVLFATGTDADLDKRLTAFFNSFSELSNQPESIALRESVLREAQGLVGTLNQLGTGVDQVRAGVAENNVALTNRINELLSDLAGLNENITRGFAMGQPDNNSLDLRTQMLSELSNLVDINVTFDDNQSMTIRIGALVVLKDDRFEKLTPEIDEPFSKFRLRLPNGAILRSTGGTLGAGIQSYENGLAEYKQRLDDIAKNLVERVNTIHRNGFGLNGSTNINFFEPDNTTAFSIKLNDALLSNVNLLAASDASDEPGSNAVALELFALGKEKVINGRGFIESAISIAADIGGRLSNIRNSIATDEAAKLMLFNQQEAISGVNIDEELTNLIKYQNAYQAAARVMQTTQQLYDTLLSIV